MVSADHQFDIVVIGGGHAGAEAAWAAARLGASTALVTMDIAAIGRMSCNPAIGGQGKGQMVREIDALGGLMGLAIDRAGIQFRMLNRSKGPAVWAPRAQADRDLYAGAVQDLLAPCRGLSVIEGCVDSFDLTDRDGHPAIRGVRLQDGRDLTARAVIVTTGTFMRGLMHCGEQRTAGGRAGEAASTGLSRHLIDLGIELRRLKTGTPARVHRDSVDYDLLEAQPGDDVPVPFSFMNESIDQPQIECYITYTDERGHDIIRANLHRAPMYTGQIQATGVRYCPSIEDKVVRFADKTRHQVFLEPEGYDNDRLYCNGLGTSLPADAQEAFLKTVRGLENVEILQLGYAVEYDYVPTHQTQYSLETKAVHGLFLAGQINGTSGYEEAGAQGLIAGINAARALRGQAPLVLRRDQAYIGVMVDDLIARPPDEPYRMFTSRAEYRLLLRSDNADDRLTAIGREIGLVDDARWARFCTKRDAVQRLEALLDERHEGVKLYDRLRRPASSVAAVAVSCGRPELNQFHRAVSEHVEIRAKYQGYVERMERDIARLKRLEDYRIPDSFPFGELGEMRLEARERFTAVRPGTLGQASRISGITPADVTVLWVALEARQRRS